MTRGFPLRSSVFVRGGKWRPDASSPPKYGHRCVQFRWSADGGGVITPRITHFTSTLAQRSQTSGSTDVIISLMEFNSGTIQTLPFGDNITIVVQNITTTYGISWNIPR
jgi:hypothetical protein